MENIGKAKAEKFSTNPIILAKPRLLDQVRQAIRSKHYSIRTEAFHGKRHPKEMGHIELSRRT